MVADSMSRAGLEVGARLAPPVKTWRSEAGGIVLILRGAAIASGVF